MKKIKIFVGVFLCMNLFTISGCDKVVHSAVIEEKDKTAAKKEENKEKETVQKTVTEQVQAPKTYQTTIQSDLRSAERTDQENPMKFTTCLHLDEYIRSTVWYSFLIRRGYLF